MKSYCVLFNPSSEGGYGEDFFDSIYHHFLKLETQPIDVFETRIDILPVWKKILEINPDFVFVCGGDGTINQVVNVMKKTAEIPIAIIPFGNGNDFSRTLYNDRNYEKLIPALYHGSEKLVDIGMIQFTNRRHYFLNEASIGISTNVIQSVQESIIPKSWAFMFYGSWNQLFGNTVNVSYRTKGLTGNKNAKLFVISNGKYFGNGMNIQPYASIEDGLFDVCILSNPSIVEVYNIMKTIYSGKKYDGDSVEYFSCKEIALNGNEIIEADGEVIDEIPCVVSIIPKGLKLIF